VPRQIRLFDEIRRTDPRPARYSEGSVAFLNRVDDPYFSAVRRLLEEWFGQHPEAHREMLRADFWSSDERSAVSAYWELYLHELHRRLGFEITVHPQVPGRSRRPDFRLVCGEHTFYLEAAVVAHSDEEMGRQSREAIVLDTINEARSPEFSLSVDWKQVGRSTPPRPEVVRKVEAWLATLDWQTERANLRPYSWTDPRRLPAPSTVIEFGDWAVSLTAYARRTRDDDHDRKTVGSPPGQRGYGNDIVPVGDSLKFKASRYGKPICRM
jgi:hypothetical protein